MARWVSYVGAAKWAGARELLIDVSNTVGVELIIDRQDRGLIGETIYFTIVGDNDLVERFKYLWRETLRYNGYDV
jgi:hypothetical protein